MIFAPHCQPLKHELVLPSFYLSDRPEWIQDQVWGLDAKACASSIPKMHLSLELSAFAGWKQPRLRMQSCKGHAGPRPLAASRLTKLGE